MSNRRNKALTTVFVSGMVVSFSSMLFLVLFYNFAVMPVTPLLISVVIGAAFQLAAYLGGVVFQRRVWPPILMLVCAVGTAWTGIIGPASLFGMPATVLANLDSVSTPLYFTTLPLTLVGIGVGIAYFVLGVISLLRDGGLIQTDRDARGQVTPPADSKAQITAQIAMALGVEEVVETPVDPEEEPVAKEVATHHDKKPKSLGKIQAFFSAEQPDGEAGAEQAVGPVEEVSPVEETVKEEPLEVPAGRQVEGAPDKAEKPREKTALETAEASAEAQETPADALAEESDGLQEPAEEAKPVADDASEPPATVEEEESSAADEGNAVLKEDSVTDDSENEAAPEEAPKPPANPFVSLPLDQLKAQWLDTPYQPVSPKDVAVHLETEHLRIVRLEQTGFAALLQGIAEMERTVGLAASGEQLDEETVTAFEALYRQALDDSDNYKWFAVWLIVSKEENKLMGSAGFKSAPDENGQVVLGYGINEACRGNNYGVEAAVALCQWAMFQRAVQVVLAETSADNVEETDLFVRAGMQPAEQAAGGNVWRLEE